MTENVALGRLFTLIMQQYFVPVSDKDKSNYKATQIITDHIRKSGVDGIAYKSAFHNAGTNYTIFNSNRNTFEYVESSVFWYQAQQQSFCDFNEKTTRIAHTREDNEYNAALAKVILEQFYKKEHPATWEDVDKQL